MDVIEVLKEDHRRIEKLFAEFFETEFEIAQQEVFQRIQTELESHSEAEELTFYPALHRYAPGTIDQSFKEHARMKELVNEINESDLNKQAFEALLNELMQDVRLHIQDEESPDGVMQIARQQLDSEALLRMGAKIEAFRQSGDDEFAA